MTDRKTILDQAINVTANARQSVYGDFSESMEMAADYINLHNQHKKQLGRSDIVTGADVAEYMAIIKKVRASKRKPSEPPHIDNYIDQTCYIAGAGEMAAKEYEQFIEAVKEQAEMVEGN